ncbi:MULTISPECIES: RHS repeat-associated core domain-containing protein [unclassified Streptomyces]|uniref:RHS repeat-associated core domain-containing protein n=1 Tax=unclassified Streptomyces TaxID=2593676 RepID=UPI0035DA3278
MFQRRLKLVAGATVLAFAVSLTPADTFRSQPTDDARAVGGSTEAITAGHAPKPLADLEALPTAPTSAAPAWPQTRTMTVAPRPGRKATAADPVAVTPLGAAAPGKVRVSTLDHASARRLGAGGIAFTLTPDEAAAPHPGDAPSATTADKTASGRAASTSKPAPDERRQTRVHVNYTGVKGAAGANFSDRVRLVRYPACVLTRPNDAKCTKAEPVATRNDRRAGELTADVPLTSAVPSGTPSASRAAAAPAVYALSAGASGDTGSFKATALPAAGSWQAGGNTGNFSYSYPLTLPDVPGGSDPALGLSYSSQAVDGRTSASNNQASAIGTGWEIGQSYIERRYQSCSEQGEPTWGDLCWASDNATISLNGVSGELIRVDKNNWRLKSDQGWKIERWNDEANGDENGEHWIVSTPEGTRYYFGLAAQPTTGTATNSTWTVPVYGKKAGSPCEGTFCNQAWRWNLALVKDRHDTEATYFYGKDTNRYHQKGGTAPTVSYDRGGYLKSIEYGHRPKAEATKAPGRVAFTYAYRCTALDDTCAAPAASSTAASYPDVPVDLICTATSCPDKFQPAFFDTRFLTRVDAQVADRDPAKAHRTVDAYTFVHQFPATGETNFDPSLWLSKITRTGYAANGATLALRPTDFNGTLLPNRVDPPTGSPKMNSWRIGTVTNELGGRTRVTYGLDANGDGQATEGCTPTTLPADESTNTRLCYKVRYVPAGGTETTGWFHKYLTLKVTAQDGANLTPEKPVTYQYLGGAAWHWSDDELTPVAKQSWSDWRGYPEVIVKAGTGTTPAVSRSRYHRGMNGDRTAAGGTKSVKVAADSFADLYPAEDLTDHEYLAGQVRTTEDLTSDGATILKATKTQHWYKRLVDGAGDHDSYFIRPQTTTSKARTAAGGYRTTRNTTTYNGTWGMPEKVLDEGDLAIGTDAKCTVTSFAVNNTTPKFLLVTPYRVELRNVTGTTCGTTVHSRSDSYYDNKHAVTDLGAPATQGDVTRVDVWFNAETSSRAYTTYDEYGRGLNAADPEGATTYTRYTPPTGNPAQISVTNAKGHTTDTDLDPLRGNPVKVVDSNGGTTTTVYDALGRVTEARLPGDPTTAEYPPSYAFEYQMAANTASRITTRQLLGFKTKDGSAQPYFSTSYAYLDTLGNTVETQTPSPLGGRIVSTGTYDDQGRGVTSSGPLYVTGAAGSGLASPPAAQWPSETRTIYDSLGQATESALYSKGVFKWKTTTAYAADQTTVTPPTGGAGTTYVNALGQVTKSIAQVAAGKTATTTFAYNIRGEAVSKKDENLNVTSSYLYDWQGRLLETNDPDRGRQWFAYDLAGRLKSSTDAELRETVYNYDELGRPIDIRRISGGTQAPVAAFTYDTLPNGLGKPVQSTRFHNGRAYTTRTLGYDEHGRPTGKQTVVPAEEGALAGTYSYSYEYTNGGAPTSIVYPAAGGLPEERVNTAYDDLGFVTGVSSPLADYTSALVYDGLGRLTTRTAGSGERRVDRGYIYDEVTGRLTNMNAVSYGARVQDLNYRYDQVGNVLAVNDALTAQQQCYGYDLGHRMTRAWTQMWSNGGTGCTQPSAWGPAPYDEQYTYDESGRILNTTKDGITTTHSYGPTGDTAAHSHAPVKVGGTTYLYNKAGQLDSRTTDGKTDTFTWEFEQLTKIATADGKETSFVYGPDGQRLIRNEPTGSTLYLDGMEVTTSTTGTKATRYYDGGVVRTSTGAGTSTTNVLVSDAQGTASVAVDQTTGAVTRQRYTPFGAPRDGENQLEETTDRDFLGQPRDDSTGLIATGARYYDPAIASFISVDPLLDKTGDAYGYGNNNPATFSDPTGLAPDDCSLIGVSCKPTGNGGFDVNYNDEYYSKRGMAKPSETKAEKKAREARDNKEAAHRKVEAIKKEIVNIIGDLIGYNDARDCFTKGDVWACINTALNFVPWGKLFKIAKAGYKAWKAWGRLSEAWGDIRAADKALAAADEAVAAERQAAKLADEAAEAKAPDEALEGITCKNSFTPGTPVLMADGTTKPIEEITNGDEVLATDPETDTSKSEEVVHTIIGSGEKHLVELTVDLDGSTGTKTGKITATHNHPFWVVNTGRWTDATALEPGDTLRTSAGTYVQVTAIARWTQQAKVHNLTVNNLHTYYVLAGATPVLVHNCGGNSAPFENDVEGQYNLADELDAAEARGVRSVSPGQAGWEEALNSGVVKWVVDTNEVLHVVPATDDAIKHSIMTRGAPVLAAGEADVAGAGGMFFGLRISNQSGHYLPCRCSINLGIEKFRQAGIDFSPGSVELVGP